MTRLQEHGTQIDPITLEILWTRLRAIADEAAAAFVRTAFSTVVREANDYACGLMDASGRALVENSFAIPGFIGAMPTAMRHFLEKYPATSWAPGDSVITNDPWKGAGHLPDIVMASPIFFGGQLVAFATSIAHAPDIGGPIWSIEGREIYEEGLQIPVVKLFEQGNPNDDVVDFIRTNVRLGDQVMGDLQAARSAARVCEMKLLELLEEQPAGMGLDVIGQAMQGRAADAMRSAIRAVPNGEYSHAIELDGYDEPLRIQAKLTVLDRSISVDYTGTSGQVPRGINCPFGSTFAHTNLALKSVLDPSTPRNDGSYEPVKVIAEPGTIVNPTYPAPVAGRQIVVLYLHCAIFGALAPVLPDRVIAESGTPHVQMVYGGTDLRGRPYVFVPFDAAGMGARPTKDGLSATLYPTNAGATSIETAESLAPLLFHKKEFATDSGGPGKYRGGLGQELVVEMLSDKPTVISVIADRMTHPAQGIMGGMPGATAAIHQSDGTNLDPKGKTTLPPGARIVIREAGGGGYGDPSTRDFRSVESDLLDGLISHEAARATYQTQFRQLREAGSPAAASWQENEDGDGNRRDT